MAELNVDDVQEAVEEEEKLYQLIRSRRGKLGALLRKRNEIDALIEGGGAKEEVEHALSHFIRFLDDFVEVHEQVQSLLTEEERDGDHIDWYQPKVLCFLEFVKVVEMWLKSDEVNADSSEKETEMNACETEQQTDVAHEHDTAVSQYDSISQVAAVTPPSEASSPGSNASQALSDARVERAQLQAQTDALDKALELEMEEL